VKVVLKGFSIDFSRSPFNPPEDVRGLAEMNQMGKVILIGPSGEAHIHLHQIKLQSGSDEEVDPEIHPSLPRWKDPPFIAVLVVKG
jgi:hypothetical protein